MICSAGLLCEAGTGGIALQAAEPACVSPLQIEM